MRMRMSWGETVSKGPNINVTDAAEILALHACGLGAGEIVGRTGYCRDTVWRVTAGSHPVLGNGEYQLYFPVRCGVLLDRVTQDAISKAGIQHVTVIRKNNGSGLVHWVYDNPQYKNIAMRGGKKRIDHSEYWISTEGILMWEHENIPSDTLHLEREWLVMRYLKMAEDGIYRILLNKLNAIDPNNRKPTAVSLRNLIFQRTKQIGE